MKLFAVYIGGEAAGANIEVHDMRFVIGESLEDTYDELRNQWWGIPKSLHLDCWSELTRADGYRITLKREPNIGEDKLYYVNLGGYDPEHFTEMHKNMFVVAPTQSKAKVRALKTVRHWTSFHQDEIFEAEQSFCINSILPEQSWYIHLEKIDDESPASFVCAYMRIGKN